MTTSQVDATAIAVGERIHALLWRHKITLGQLGDAIGVSQSTASKKVRGVVPMTVSELVRTAQLLGVDAASLLDGSAPTQPGGWGFESPRLHQSHQLDSRRAA